MEKGKQNVAGSSNYVLLLSKLNEFTRKFYLNRIIRGALLTLGVLIATYLLLSFLEFRFFFTSPVRKVLFFGFLTAAVILISRWLVVPVLHYMKMGKVISHHQAAYIIGRHFSQVEDRLLNVLELRAQIDGEHDQELIEASINQKIEGLKPVPFTLAVNLGDNKRYLPWALPPVVLLIFMLFAAPDVLRESNERLLQSNRVFERPMPFQFVVNSNPLEVVQFDDFELLLSMQGDVVPDEVEIQIGPYTYKMNRSNTGNYSYDFVNVREQQSFYFKAGGFRSQDFVLSVLPKPVLQRFTLSVDYPSHTGIADVTFENTGDVQVPEGSTLVWKFSTQQTSDIGIRFSDSLYMAERRGDNLFTLERTLYEDENYSIGLSNEQIDDPDSIVFSIGVIPDQYPSVSVEQFADSTNSGPLYFVGQVADDYGLRNLNFYYELERPDRKGNPEIISSAYQPLEIGRNRRQASFSWSFDPLPLGLLAGDRLTYYFEVWDNDGVNGSKSSRSVAMVYEMPTEQQLKDEDESQRAELKDDLENSLQDIRDAREEIKELREKLLQKKQLDWSDTKQVQSLVDKQEQIREQLENLDKQFGEHLEKQSKFKQNSEELIEKQQRLQEMFELIADEKLKQMFEELDQLLEEMKSEQAIEDLENLELNDEELEKEMDRMMELFKQMEFQQKMEDIIDELTNLSEEQKELSEESLQKDADKQDLKDQQEQVNEAFEEIAEDIDELEKLNEELEQSNSLENTDSQQEEISESLENSSESLENNKRSKASEQQQQAGDQMQQLASQMQQNLSEMQQQQEGEDLQALRQLLDNLIKLSFDQEDLMNKFQKVQINSPAYVELVQSQFKIQEDAELVEDSLLALAKRVYEISSYVMRELNDMNRYMDNSIENMAERKRNNAVSDQQYVMTAMNNLALMLDEVMQQMQQQMASQMPGNQMCQKPGKNKGKSQAPGLGDLQKQMSQQIQQMKDAKKGGNPLGSKEFAQMAAKQAAMRDALRRLSEAEKGGGQKPGDSQSEELAKELSEISDQMERTEEQLINKVFTDEMLERQKDIMTRLLEAESAERQRDMDDKRESQTADEISREVPPSLEEYLHKRQTEIDLYKTVSPNLKPYYQKLVEDYIRVVSHEP